MAAPLCITYKKDGFRCNKLTLDGVRCGVHNNCHIAHLARFGPLGDTQCEYTTTTQRCNGERVDGSSLCRVHFDRYREMRITERARVERRNHVENHMRELRDRVPRPSWQNAIRDYVEMVNAGVLQRDIGIEVCRRFAAFTVIIFPVDIIERYWDWVVGGEEGPEPQLVDLDHFLAPPPVIQRQPQNRLVAIARDNQNVHTREVSEQTNKSTDILMGFYTQYCAERKSLRTPDWVAARWLPETYGSWDKVSRIVNDMQHWYKTTNCRAPNDRLYKKLIDGLYTHIGRIEDRNTAKEIYKRMFEECNEAVGMCCEGHISRLCNVLVGFDDNFAPPVPKGELLQNEMAKIANKDVSEEIKVQEAREVLKTLNIPNEEWNNWLEAF